MEDGRPRHKLIERLELRRAVHRERHPLFRIAFGIGGVIVTLAGVIMLVTPGPAFVLIPIGLAMLSMEFVWAERLLVKHLRRAGITGWVLGHPLGPYSIDLAFPAARLAVEVDGWAWHTDPARFAADRHKGNAITRAGWDLLRFTWHDLDGRPAACLREIDDLLVRAAA